MRFATVFCILAAITMLSAQESAVKLKLNTNVNYRTVTGVEAGNYLDVSLMPTLNVADILSAQVNLSVPYNLSTNQIRKVDTKIGNILRYVRLGGSENYVATAALEEYSLGLSGLIVNRYNNQIDETNKKIGAVGNVSLGGLFANAMVNDVSKPKVIAGSAGLVLAEALNLVVSASGGMDTDPDNNSSTSGNVSAFGAEVSTRLDISDENYFYAVGGIGKIAAHGDGQIAALGAKFGTSGFNLNLEGSFMRLGQGFEWGFFDAFYERDRLLGVNKADGLEVRNPKTSGGTNLSVTLGYNPQSVNEFGLALGGYYFTNYAGTDLNEFAAGLGLYIPRIIIGEEGELASANIVLKAKSFKDIGGLIDVLKNPDNKTVISVDAPITLLNNLAGLGRLAFVVNYSWNFAFDPANKFYTPQKDLKYGFRLISN